MALLQELFDGYASAAKAAQAEGAEPSSEACRQEGEALLKLANQAMADAIATFRAGLQRDPTNSGLKSCLDDALHRGKGDNKVDDIMDKMDSGLERCMKLVREIRSTAEQPVRTGVGRALAVPRVKTLLITANTGSLFEDPIFEQPFLDVITGRLIEQQPDFAVVHFQEMCGKEWKTRDTLDTANDFTKKLAERLPGFWNSGLLFKPAKSGKDKTFTALACIAIARADMVDADRLGVYDFDQGKVVRCTTEDAPLSVGGGCYRSGFFQEAMFPEIKLGRKGWLHTRFVIDEKPVDFVNMHLFHDASNLESLKSSYPSVYAQCRKRAFEYVMEHINFDTESKRAFLFGDFNFRLELPKVVAHVLGEDAQSEDVDFNGVAGKVLRGQGANENELSIAPKKFVLKQTIADWPALRPFDVEVADTIGKASGNYSECAIDFDPTYPYEEDIERMHEYIQNRCPGWCDRIFMTSNARANAADLEYAILGKEVCVGDHKPLYLQLNLG